MHSRYASDLDLEVSNGGVSLGDDDLTPQVDGVVGRVDVPAPVEVVASRFETEPVLTCCHTHAHTHAHARAHT